MLDAVNFERRGIPAAVVGQDKTLGTTGKGMAIAQGYPNLRFAVIPYGHTAASPEEEIMQHARDAARQVERILTSDA